jgi:hypothetical protein
MLQTSCAIEESGLDAYNLIRSTVADFTFFREVLQKSCLGQHTPNIFL